MSLLKRLPIAFEGDLHDVKLINFTVDPAEIRDLIPANIPIRLINGRAMISMVIVSLREMKPTFLPGFAHFNYRHVGFRVLVDDEAFTGKQSKGIFFLRSFTDKKFIAKAGQHLTNYRLETGSITCTDLDFMMEKEGQFLKYRLINQSDDAQPIGLKEVVRNLDRAYATDDRGIWMTRVLRISWPIEEVKCAYFETNFFKTARFEGAFRIKNVIRYNWAKPKLVETKARIEKTAPAQIKPSLVNA